ncbi:MAG: HAD family hydrolase [Candidatus Thorarchaeota archaeon]|jgi:phosphoserine phosphatase
MGVTLMVVRLVVFDVDGTLTNHSSIWWRLHEHFGTEEKGRLYYDQYFAGEINYNQWADLDASLWKGQSVEEVRRLVKATELVPGASETITRLKEAGIKVAILSGGLDILAEDVARRVGVEYALTNRLLHSNGILTGEVESKVGWGEKVQEIRQICNHFNVSLKETAFVGDGRNDLSVFDMVGLSIAFRPEDEEVAAAAMVTIREDNLGAILNHIL